MLTRQAIEQAAQQAEAFDPEAVYLITKNQGINYDGQPTDGHDTCRKCDRVTWGGSVRESPNKGNV